MTEPSNWMQATTEITAQSLVNNLRNARSLNYVREVEDVLVRVLQTATPEDLRLVQELAGKRII